MNFGIGHKPGPRSEGAPIVGVSADLLVGWSEERLRRHIGWLPWGFVLAPILAMGLASSSVVLPRVRQIWDLPGCLAAGFALGLAGSSAWLLYLLQVRRLGRRVGATREPWSTDLVPRALLGLVVLALISAMLFRDPGFLLAAVVALGLWGGIMGAVAHVLARLSNLQTIRWLLGLGCLAVGLLVGSSLALRPEVWVASNSAAFSVTLWLGIAVWWRSAD